MKNFFEMWKMIEQGAVAAQPMPNATPNVQQNNGPNAAPNQQNAAQNKPNVSQQPDQQNPEIQKFVNELTKMLDDGTDLGNFQSQLKKYISNPSFQEAATKSGPEDKLAVNSQPIEVSLLFPTQSEIFLENSVDASLENTYGNAPQIIAGTNPAAAGSVVVAQVGSQYHIIDGHHRWSQFVCFNPKSKIQCKIVSGMRSALQGLKVTHLAVAIEKKNVPSETGNANSNLLQMSKEQVAEYVKNKIGTNQTKPKDDDKTGQPVARSEPILDMFRKSIPTQNLPNARQASLDEIANYVGENSQLVEKAASKATQKNLRTIMPQTGGTNFDTKLSGGEVNITPQASNAKGQNVPAQSRQESQKATSSLNEWLILAGVNETKN